MKKTNKKEILIWIAAVIPFIITALLYRSLPEKIPMHWNIRGEIDSWGGRTSAFFIPLMGLGISFLLKFLPRIDPKYNNYVRFGNAYFALRLVFVLFMGFMSAIVLYGAYNPSGMAVNLLVPAGIGILFCVIGNFMPKFKHNYFVGIKTPWTLANEEVWRRTHRLSGILWFWGGLFLTFSVFVVPSSLYFTFVLAAAFVLSLVPMVYSYIIFHKIKKTDKE